MEEVEAYKNIRKISVEDMIQFGFWKDCFSFSVDNPLKKSQRRLV